MSLAGVLQLSSLTIRFCKSTPASQGVRDLLLRDGVAAFARAHPTVELAVAEAPARAPFIAAKYLDGSSKTVGMVGFSAEEVARVMARLRDTTTAKRRSFRAPVTTGAPSVQGVWDAGITYKGFELREAKEAVA